MWGLNADGCKVVSVPCDDDTARPGFAYTMGLGEVGHPEFVVVGLGDWHAHRILSELGERVQQGASFADGDHLTCSSITPSTVRLVEVDAVEIPGQRVLQIVYADFRGAFPWDASYRYPSWLQRVPELSVA